MTFTRNPVRPCYSILLGALLLTAAFAAPASAQITYAIDEAGRPLVSGAITLP